MDFACVGGIRFPLTGGCILETQELKAGQKITTGVRIVTRPRQTARRHAFGFGDVLAASVIGAAPFIALLPDTALRALCLALSRVLPMRWQQQGGMSQLRRLGGLRSNSVARGILRRQLEMRLLSLAMVAKDLVWRRGYDVAVHGEGHIDEALAKGRGVVIWIADFVFAGDVAKQGLFRIGHGTCHMSRPEHGFSQTAFGIRYLNPVRLSAEMPFMRERIVFDRQKPSAALARLSECLAANLPVSLLACADEGVSLVEADIFNGRLPLATGAPRLAWKAKCPILPVFTVPSPQPPYFVVDIGPPLAMTSPQRDEAILQAVSDFVARLEPYVAANPHLWRGWSSLLARHEDESSRNNAEVGGLASAPLSSTTSAV